MIPIRDFGSREIEIPDGDFEIYAGLILLMVEAGCLSSIRCRFDSVTQYLSVCQWHAKNCQKTCGSSSGKGRLALV